MRTKTTQPFAGLGAFGAESLRIPDPARKDRGPIVGDTDRWKNDRRRHNWTGKRSHAHFVNASNTSQSTLPEFLLYSETW